jgi:hypothetical protein
MSFPRRPIVSVLAAIAAFSAFASAPASAVVLSYRIANTSLLTGTTSVVGDVDMEPDLADAFPTFLIASGTTNTRPRGTLVADVPLAHPTGNPITFESGTITFPSLGRATGGGIVTLPSPPLPGLPVGGSQVFAMTFDLGDLTLVIEPPFTTTDLFATGDGQWTFAALATGTLSGTVSPELLIPTVDPVVVGPVPIAPTAVVVPIVGTFSEGPSGTRLTIGLDDAADPLTFDLDVETLDFVLLPGLVEFHATLDTLSLADPNLLIEATNATPLPSSGRSCGLGAELALLGLGSRRVGRRLVAERGPR